MKYNWMVAARVTSALVLLFATASSHYRMKQESGSESTFWALYLFVGISILFSLFYVKQFVPLTKDQVFAYVQLAIDSALISLFILLTGGFFSLFTFLYLVAIIYATMVLYLKGGLWVALLSSLQYAAIIYLQFQGHIPALFSVDGNGLGGINNSVLINKILITSSACFAVAILSGLLTEQNRKTQNELSVMESHVKRVEKMAYMGEMAAGLAHEIKNPLASVVGSIQLLKEDLRYDPDHRRLMEIILRETDRLSTLVNDFLLFARPPAGKPKLIELSKAVEEIVGLFERDRTHAKHHTLKKILTQNVFVVMDSGHLSQVLWNLLLNAAEAIEDGGVIEIHMVSSNSSEVSIHVKDNGCGMPPEVERSIFDPFFTTKSEGTGLGLSIVHRILEAYDTRLDIHTKPGAGTTVSFTLKRSGRPSS